MVLELHQRRFVKLVLAGLVFLVVCKMIGDRISESPKHVEREDHIDRPAWNSEEDKVYKRQSADISSLNYISLPESNKHREDQNFSEEMTVISIVCFDHRRHLRAVRGNMTRQMVQLATLIKSLFIFSSRPINYILITDSQETYDSFIEYLFSSGETGYGQTWPKEFTQKIRISRREAKYPEGTTRLKFNYLACTTVKLFLSHIVPDVDAAIVIDTDFLFLRPLDDLWSLFNRFDDKQMYGMVESYAIYNTRKNRVPYFGESGLNCGLIMVNLTRINPMSQFLTDRFMSIYSEHWKYVKYGDQDIFNPFFAEHPEFLYVISCDWNSRFHYCKNDGSYECEESGVSAYHGAVGGFVTNTDYKVTAMFEAVRNVKMTTQDLRKLPYTMMQDLRNVEIQDLPYRCTNISLYDYITTKHLFDFFYDFNKEN